MNRPLWPAVTTEKELDALGGRLDLLRPGLAAIAGQHDWSAEPEEHFTDGSLPVFALDPERVLKLYPGPMYTEDFVVESRVLSHIAGRVAAPVPLLTGELDGWSYLVMTRLRGRSMASAWPDIPAAARLQLLADLGRWVSALHALPTDGLELPPPTWPEFLAKQYATATARQREVGLGEPWLSDIELFLGSVELAATAPEVLLHTEIMPEHAFVIEGDEKETWQLSGVLDFEPAMIGPREYELASVGIFATRGEPNLLRAFLTGYGCRDDQLEPQLQQRAMAYALLHRYSHLPWYLRRNPPAAGIERLAALAPQWWAL